MVRRAGRAGLHPRARGTRRSTCVADRDPRHDPGPPRGVPDRAGHHQRDLLRRAEVHPVPRQQQHRQRGTGLPRAVDDDAEEDDRRRRDDVLLHRRHRQRPHRAVRRQRRQRAAGVHEVPVPGAQARRQGRGGQPVARARARPLLGAEQRRERDVRHADDRRVLRGAHRRRPRVPERCAQGAARPRATIDRDFVREHTDGLRRRSSPSSSASRSPTSSGSRARRAPTWSGSPAMYASADARCSSGRWASPSTSGAPTTSPRSSTSAWRGATSAGPAPASCRSAATPACRAAPRWAPTPPRFPAGSTVNAANRRRAGRAVRLPGRRPPRPHRRGDGRGGRARRARRPLLVRRQLPRGAARSRRRSRRRWRGCRCASTRTSSCRARCSSIRARWSCCCPAATRYEQRDGGTETTTERRIAFSPEIDGPRPGEVRSEWEIFVELARRVDPDRAGLMSFASGQAIRDEIARVVPDVRGRRGAAHDRRRGPVGRDAAVRGRRVPDRRRPGPVPGRRAVGARRAARELRAEHPPRQAVQHDGARGARPAHRRDARRAVHGARRHRPARAARR